jgi:hypothetical protein
MKWIKRSFQEPNPELKQILVFGDCGKQHVAYYDYEDWGHTECCYENGHHFHGVPIDFEYWMPLPDKPGFEIIGFDVDGIKGEYPQYPTED